MSDAPRMSRGLVASAWDMLHPGHCYFLNEAKKQCDELIVCLHVDPSIQNKTKHSPVQTLYERYYQLSCHKAVDIIVPYSSELDLRNILIDWEIDIRFLGSDYEGRKFTGDDLDIQTWFIPRHHSYSSTELRHRLTK